MKKVMIVFGTRPEAIKMAPLCLAFREESTIQSIVCVTGQHREMLDQVLHLFGITPDIDLNIMKKGQDLFDVTAQILQGMKKVIDQYKPDLILVHGDTTTTFATSLAAFYSNTKIGHVEAGLRTNNMQAPFPEEFNRQSTGLIADYHFTPTELTKENLKKEKKQEQKIIVTGNTVIDALHLVLDIIHKDSEKELYINNFFEKLLDIDINKSQFVLITGHRRENFGDGFLNICHAIKQSAIKNPNTYFIYPVHLNPNVQQPVKNILSDLSNVLLIEPLEYENFIYLLEKSYLVLTDSGGIQEEAPSLGKPVLVMRDVTERPEAIQAGTVKLIGSTKHDIVKNINLLLNNKTIYRDMSKSHNPYGNGNACKKIVEHVKGVINDC